MVERNCRPAGKPREGPRARLPAVGVFVGGGYSERRDTRCDLAPGQHALFRVLAAAAGLVDVGAELLRNAAVVQEGIGHLADIAGGNGAQEEQGGAEASGAGEGRSHRSSALILSTRG
jgi:hypothetical protein